MSVEERLLTMYGEEERLYSAALGLAHGIRTCPDEDSRQASLVQLTELLDHIRALRNDAGLPGIYLCDEVALASPALQSKLLAVATLISQVKTFLDEALEDAQARRVQLGPQLAAATRFEQGRRAYGAASY